jgi:hypothetical protein
LGSGRPETRRSEAGQHELRPDLRGIGGNDVGIGKPLIGGCGAGGTLATITLSKVRGEIGEEGREGSRRVSGQDRICCSQEGV